MRLMGVDFGFKRIGLAVTDEEPFLPTPRPSLAATGTLANDAVALKEFAGREGVDLVVIGLPIEENGEEGKMARIVRKLGERLLSEGVSISFADERFTSVHAESMMKEAGLKGSDRRKRKDGEAACLILETYRNG